MKLNRCHHCSQREEPAIPFVSLNFMVYITILLVSGKKSQGSSWRIPFSVQGHVLGEQKCFQKSRFSDSNLKLKKEERSRAGFLCTLFLGFPASRRDAVAEAKMEVTSPMQLPQSRPHQAFLQFLYLIFISLAPICAFGSISSRRGKNHAGRSFVHCLAQINSLDADSLPAQKVL